jgi:hypothetical protein
MKEEISVYFRMAFQDGRCGAGTGPAWMGSGKRSALEWLQRGKGTAPFPKKHGNGFKNACLGG